MKRATRQEYPPGWNKKKVRAVIAHYDQQTQEEAAIRDLKGDAFVFALGEQP